MTTTFLSLAKVITALTILARTTTRASPIQTQSRGLGHDTAKNGCPPGHISDCRYIVMMHPRKRDNSPDLDQVTIDSTGTYKITTTMQEDPEWFKLLNTHQDEQQTRTTTSPKPTITSVTVGDLVWYSTTMSPTAADQIQQQQHKHQIKYLIADLPVQMYGRVQSHSPSWGLDRIDQRTDKLDGLYHYPKSAGQNVTIYVIDTGVNIDHKDFEGRAQHGPVFAQGVQQTDNADRNGHGTFVAALAAGATYGVAKKGQIVSLKALDDAGAGRLSNVLAAIEWVVKRHVSQGSAARSIINLSLGAEFNGPTNEAIQEAMRLGIHFSIAAGNDGKDACQFSPASTPGAMTVGATDKDDTIASYSNFGPCVAIFAPGSAIVSAWAESNTATHVQSGTSMASPHVAGLMALLLSESPGENIPVKVMNERILGSVTKFSLNGQLVTDGVSPLPPSLLSISSTSTT
ncbi:MAG: peptidase S8/S53 domain-containing protein, partial [Linnemannia elongata]